MPLAIEDYALIGGCATALSIGCAEEFPNG
jgi:hypothetical protein